MQPSDNWRKALLETLSRLQAAGTRRARAAGYSPKQIIEQLRLIAKAADSRCPSQRNLSLQLRAALRRAVGEGLLKLRAGRYVLRAVDERKSDKKKSSAKEDSQPKQAAAVEDALPAANKSKTKKSGNKRPAAARKRAKAKKSTRAKR